MENTTARHITPTYSVRLTGYELRVLKEALSDITPEHMGWAHPIPGDERAWQVFSSARAKLTGAWKRALRAERKPA